MQFCCESFGKTLRTLLCLALGLALASLTARAQEPAAFTPADGATLSAGPDNSTPQVTRLPAIEPVAAFGVTPSGYVQPAVPPDGANNNDLLRRLEATEAELRAASDCQ